MVLPATGISKAYVLQKGHWIRIVLLYYKYAAQAEQVDTIVTHEDADRHYQDLIQDVEKMVHEESDWLTS